MVDLELANALLEEAKHDLNAARICLDGGEFARSVQHSLEGAEKAVKAFLCARGHGTIIEHEVSAFLAEEMALNSAKFDEETLRRLRGILELLYGLEENIGATRYPRRIRGRIMAPSTAFNKEKAENCLKDAEGVLDAIGTLFITLK